MIVKGADAEGTMLIRSRLNAYDEIFATDLSLRFQGKSLPWIKDAVHPNDEGGDSYFQMKGLTTNGIHSASRKDISNFLDNNETTVWYGHSNGCRILMEYLKFLKAQGRSDRMPKKVLLMSPAMSKSEIEMFSSLLGRGQMDIIVVAGENVRTDAASFAYWDRARAAGSNVHGMSIGTYFTTFRLAVTLAGHYDPELGHHSLGANADFWNQSAERFFSWDNRYWLYHGGNLEFEATSATRGSTWSPIANPSPYNQMKTWLTTGNFNLIKD